jgi:ribosomal protein S18 acetylase RimI-like enzyme
MVVARRAVAADAAEVVRLRALLSGGAPTRAWVQQAMTRLAAWLEPPDPEVAVVVTDKPGRSGELAACAIGEISRSLADPGNPSGVRGHVFNVVTDPGYRRRGHARACMSLLLEWFDQVGVGPIDCTRRWPVARATANSASSTAMPCPCTAPVEYDHLS